MSGGSTVMEDNILEDQWSYDQGKPPSKHLTIHQSTEPVALGQDVDVSTILAGAWVLLLSLLTNSESIQLESALPSDEVSTSPWLPHSVKSVQASVDWSSSVAKYLETISTSLHSSHSLVLDQKVNGEPIAPLSTPTFQSQLLLLRRPLKISEVTHLRQRLQTRPDDLYNVVVIPVELPELGKFAFEALFYYQSEVAERAAQVERQCERLVQSLAHADRDTRLNSLDLLQLSERRQVLKWNAAYPRRIDDCVHHVVDQRMHRQPSAVAVCAWDMELTYKDLVRRAGKLASRLIALGVRAETAVLIYFDKSAWAAVAMLAILKAGGAIVAVDPTDSQERTKTIITAAKVNIALASRGRSDVVEDLLDHVVIVDEDSLAQLPEPECPVAAQVSPGNTAWIIFTSGSTGKPKGVVLEHSAICTSAQASGNAKHIDEKSRVFAFSNYIFDGVIQDYFFTFIRGGCCCIPSEKDRTDNLAQTMNDLNVNWAFLTPSVVSLLSPSDVPELKVLTLGGEALTSENVRRWADSVTVQNTYGPAECTVGCAVREYEDGNGDPRNIGFPIGSLAWIVNPFCHDQLLPRQCVGELALEGPMLARGYLGDLVTTARSFKENPSWLPERSSRASRRIYLTGDLVKQEDDGSLVFLGRKDTQIKLHGQRIAISDLNDFFSTIKFVKHAYVAVPTSGYLRQTLACVVSLNNVTPAGETLQPLRLLDGTRTTALQMKLDLLKGEMSKVFAKYMVPTTWILVEDLALTPSSKIDGVKIKKWLDSLDDASQTQTAGSRSTRALQPLNTKMELEVQLAWNQVLNITTSKIGKESTFLSLGGNSLRAMALTAHLRTQGISLPVADILRNPALHDMAVAAKWQHETTQVTADISLTDGPLDSIADQCGVSPDAIEDVYPAAPFQEALLALTSKDPGAYVVHRKFHIADHVDIARLRAAWLATCRANPILRTRFIHDQQHGTVQVVIKDSIWWSHLDSPGEEHSSAEHSDFTFGCHLLRLSVSGRMLQVSMHHAIYDGWSIPLILEDVDRAYAIGSPMIRPSFKSFVKYLAKLDHAQSEAYWKARLSNTSTRAFPSSPEGSHQPQCTGSVQKTIAIHRDSASPITTATLATAVWATVVSGYVGSEDVCFGLITSGRFVPVNQAEAIIGPLVATVPMRVRARPNPDMSVSEFLKQIQDDTIEMMPYVHYGLQRIQNISPELRTASAFNNTFIVHPRPDDLNPSPILQPEDVSEVNPADYSTYPLHVSCTLQNGGLEAKMRFDPAVITQSQTEYLLEYFADTLQGMVSGEASATLKDVTRLSPKLSRIVTATSGEEPETVNACVHELIESQALDRPSAPAVRSWDASLTYAELNGLSNKLAHHLSSSGVRHGSHVCFSFEKSSLPVVAILAIMKAGAAVVPLDISLPIDRIKAIVKQCQAQAVLCSNQQSEALQLESLEMIAIDFETLLELPDIDGPSCDHVQPADLAYTIYTSGSTGVPKGCMWEHRTLSSSAMAHGKAMSMGTSSRVMQFSAYAWDISVCETITTLVHGGCICIPSEETRLNDTIAFMNEMEVNWAWFTPTFARSVNLKEALHLKTLVLGGEVIGQDNVDNYRDHFQLLTGYGPAECCVAVSVADFSANSGIKSGNIGIGVGCRLWIVDQDNSHTLVPFGGIGEILIEGGCVGKGYLRDPERTAASFLTNLSWAEQQASGRNRRFYRSGDLGRANADGSVTFLGRNDQQVKIRGGQRLELGEVEHHLLDCPDVKHAVALVPSSASFSGRLVAVLAMRNTSTNHPTTPLRLIKESDNTSMAGKIEQVKKSLSKTLPPFGVPSVWLPVADVPLTASGKLDRVQIRDWALEALEHSPSSYSVHSNTSDDGVAVPRTPRERSLQRAWSEVLHLPNDNRIGRDHSFLQLEGDSIHAIRLVALLRSQGLSLTVADIFKNPVLRDMATKMSTSALRNKESPQFSLLPSTCNIQTVRSKVARLCGVAIEDVEDIYPSTPLQEAVMSLNMVRPGTYFAQLVYEAPHDLYPDRLESAWQTVTQAHTVLRTRLVDVPSLGTLQVVVRNNLSFAIADDLSTFLQADSQCTIDLGHKMARLAVIGRHIVLTAHHAAYDGFSLPMVKSDLMLAYQGLARRRPPFQHFMKFLSESNAGASEAFWSSYLSDYTPSNFPWYPQSLHEVRAHACKTINILLDQAPTHGITVATIANAAWALVIAAYANTEDASFGTTLAGRDVSMHGIEELPGPTLATVPVRVSIDRGGLLLEFLQKFQTNMLDIMACQHLGLQRIKRLTNEAQAACDFRTVFVVFPLEEEDRSGLRLIPERSTGDADNFSMYPLTVLFRQTSEGAHVSFNYDENIIAQQQVNYIASYYRHLVQAILSCKKETIVRQVLDIPPHHRASIDRWTNTTPRLESGYVHFLFNAQVSKQPTASAINAWDGGFTYQDLDALSTRLAHALKAHGAREGMFVAYCFAKSKWAIVAMMAILKSNAAFLPLNYSDSIERKRQLVSQCNIPILVTSSSLYDEHHDIVSAVISLDMAYIDTLPMTRDLIEQTVTSTSPAVCIPTSGSTGIPKAVVISHSALGTSILSLVDEVRLTSTTRSLQFVSYVFDLSVLEIMGTLVIGGCCCVPSEEDRMGNLSVAVKDLNADWALFTPTLLRSLRPDQFPSLKTVVLGGEVVGEDIIQNWASRVQLLSVWAPAETTIANTVIELHSPEQSGGLGKVVNARLWLTQPQTPNLLAPIGAVGEITASGPTLALGYHKDPDRTAASFIEGLEWSDTKSRFYRTGDLARYTSDGRLYFVGRRDAQIKIRGQRTELGDVEHHLNRCASIQDATAVYPSSGPFAKQLAAVFSLAKPPHDWSSPSQALSLLTSKGNAIAEQLRRIESTLAEGLPSHAVPSVFIPVNDLPKTASGKLDRRQIQRWVADLDRPTVDQLANLADPDSDESPQTSNERHLQQVWADVLNIIPKERIGRNTSFFNLGGDSISGMHVVSRCRAAGASITVQALMRSKTLARTAEQMHVARFTQVDSSDDNGDSFELSPIQQVFANLGAIEHRFHQSFLLCARTDVTLPALKKATKNIVERHPMLHSRLERSDTGSWQLRIVAPSEKDICVFMATSRSQANTEAAIEQAQTCIDLQSGPVIAAAMIKTTDKHYVFLTAHHMVIDLVSWRVVIEALEEQLAGRSLPHLGSTTFKKWVQSQSEYIQQPGLKDKQLPYVVPSSDMDYWGMTQRANVVDDAVEKSFVLDEPHTSLLFGSANRAFTTEPVDLLLAGMWIAFGNVFHDRSFPAIFTEGHGREPWASSVDVSQTVGWFTTLQALMLDLDSDASLLEVVEQMKDSRRRLPRNGWAAFTGCAVESRLGVFFGGQPPVEILFNFAGSFQQLEKSSSVFTLIPAGEMRRGDHGSGLRRLGLFEFSLYLQDGSLRVSLSLNRQIRHINRVEEWMSQFERCLTAIGDELSQRSMDFTLSDFPLLHADYLRLQTITKEVLPSLGLADLTNVEDMYHGTTFTDLFQLEQRHFPTHNNCRWTVKLSPRKGRPKLNVTRLISGWLNVVEKHAALRTICVDLQIDKSLFQQIVFRECSPQVFQLEAKDDQEARRMLDDYPSLLHTKGVPAHSMGFCVIPTGDIYVRMEINHAYMDGHTMGLLWKALTAAYFDQLPEGRVPQLSDYMAHVQKQSLEANTLYWKYYLEDVEPAMLPTGPKPPEQPDGQVAADVSSAVNAGLMNAFCQKNEVTIPAVLLAGWGLLLISHNSHNTSCSFACPSSGRDVDVPGVQEIFGPLLTCLVQRIDFKKDESFLDLVSRVQANGYAHLEHQFFYWMEAIPHSTKLFNTVLSIQPMSALLPGPECGMNVEHVHADDNSGLDWLITLSYSSTELSLLLKYHRARTTPEYAQEVGNAFATILNTIISQPLEHYSPSSSRHEYKN